MKVELGNDFLIRDLFGYSSRNYTTFTSRMNIATSLLPLQRKSEERERERVSSIIQNEILKY
jgi:hypothetical protein